MMNSQLKTGVVLFLGAVMLAACGDKSSSGVNLKDPKSVALTTISDTNAAAKVASAMFGGDKTAGDPSGDVLTIIGGAVSELGVSVPGGAFLSQVSKMQLPQIASLDAQTAKALELTKTVVSSPALRTANAKFRVGTEALVGKSLRAVTTEEACDVGSMTTSIDDVAGEFQVIFKDCKVIELDGSYEVKNGKLKMNVSGTEISGSLTLVLGDGDASLEADDFVVAKYTANGTAVKVSTTSLAITISATNDTVARVAAITVDVNGRVEDVNSVKNITDEVAFDNFSFAIKVNSAAMASFDMTLNGAVEVKHDLGATPLSPDMSQYLGFVNFAYAVTEASTGATTVTINGKIVSELSPVACGHGSYQIATTAPITRNKDKKLTGGVMTINTNTTITANANGSIHVVVNGTSADFASEKEMNNSLCL